MGGMRGFAWLVVGLSCRPHSTGGSVDAGNRQGEIEAAARGEKIRPLRFARPVTAARMEHGIGVVARDRATGELAFAEFDDNALVVLTTVPLPAKLDDPELLVSSGDLAVLARAPADGGRARVSLRIAMGGDGGATVIDSRPVGSAACSTLDGVYSLERDGAGWRGSFRSLTLAGGEERGPRLGASSEVTIVCGQHRAFVVVNGRGEQRVVAWAPEGHDARPTILPKPPLPDPDEGALMAAKGDELVVAKIQKSTLATLVLQNNHGAIWRVADVAAGDGLALETLEPGEGVIGLLFIRTVSPVKGCSGSEKTDAVAEVALADAASGKIVRAPEPIETWRCGAEPGPFFSGWIGGRLVIAWPRSADSACARAGVRHGGIGFAEVEPGAGHVRVTRLSRPFDAIAGAGCDEKKCYAVALTRGADPCGPADGPDTGRLEVIVYPP